MTKTDLYKALIKANTGSHRDVANCFILMFGHLYTTQMQDGKVCIFYRKSIDDPWKESCLYQIKHHLSTQVSIKLYECSRLVFSKAFDSKNDLLKPNYITVATNLVRIGSQLKNQYFKNQICKEVLEMLVCR